MALKATIFKAELQISNIDSHYYETHPLTIARHPSETDARMMLRVFAFALHAQERLEFTRGLSTDTEPDIWQKNLTGDIEVWIELGQPDEKRIRKAAHAADEVFIYCYQGKSVATWWPQIEKDVRKFNHVTVLQINDESVEAMAAMAQRQMDLTVTIQDGQYWINDNNVNQEIVLTKLSSG